MPPLTTFKTKLDPLVCMHIYRTTVNSCTLDQQLFEVPCLNNCILYTLHLVGDT